MFGAIILLSLVILLTANVFVLTRACLGKVSVVIIVCVVVFLVLVLWARSGATCLY